VIGVVRPTHCDRLINVGVEQGAAQNLGLIRIRKIIDEPGADVVVAAAENHALVNKYRVVIAVVDAYGELIHLRRTPGAQIASSRVAVDKARTAARFVRPSRAFEDQVTTGRLGALALHGAAALTGGVPLTVDGEVVGAIGTSGETPDQDESVSLAGAQASFSSVPSLDLTEDGARVAGEAVAAEARRRAVWPVAAVVDAGGELIYVWRPNQAQVASVDVAVDKARTAAIYRRPSRDFEEQAAHGRPSALHLARAVPLMGGMPITYEQQVIGAVGVSGASSAEEDHELSAIGAQAIGAAEASDDHSATAVVIGRQALDDKFQTGGLLVDARRYKLDAGRRIVRGEVEYHEHFIDVIHVVHGQATLVTGGEMLDARTVGDGERRARSIRGGETHQIREGDVVSIPNSVPHQFVAVSDPFLYLAVKINA
jgi:uncharacterized protein GlcG (DUF336 family)/uncharacterized protein YjlB